VSGLCARGGFEVELNWNEGRLTKAVIRSKVGQLCRIVYGDQTWEFKTKAGKSYPLTLATK
jgi:alpha-L-fucosidase 2